MDDIYRYSKQLILDGFGKVAQDKLKKSKVLVVGAGGLGSSALFYLAAAGVGTIGICDFDTVTSSNLNRQIIHFTPDIHKNKTQSAAEKIALVNPEVRVIKHDFRLTIKNIDKVISSYDVVIDATDNVTSRYLISDCCFFQKKPLIEGAAVGYIGQIMTIIPPETACYRCLYPIPPKDGVLHTCGNTGILGMVTGVIGSMQALEAIKIITEIGVPLTGRLLFFDALLSSYNEIIIVKNSTCPLCGKMPSIKELVEYDVKCKLI